QDVDEPWPLGAPEKGAAGEMALWAVYGAGRNFFDGRLMSTSGEERQVLPFFSAAALPVNGSMRWILEGVDGRARVFSNTYQAIETFGVLQPVACCSPRRMARRPRGPTTARP